ncbi:MAG: tetratricopeptide repeat protein [Geminicoccaceae bacterium]
MMPYGRVRQVGLVVATVLGVTLFGPLSHGQDAAWEGLINAGRDALQQQNFSEAERHFESALEAAESFPSGDARLGKSYNNLAAVYYAQQDYARAEPLMRRALTQLQEALGPENTEVAQTIKNLAALYYLRGDRDQAETLLRQSLAILEKVHGPNHAFVATVLSNLAGLYQAEDRYQDAEPLLTRSLGIWESLLGPDHPDVIKSRALLAQVKQATGGEIAQVETTPQQSAAVSEADTAGAEGVPIPALNPIGDAANTRAANTGVANTEIDAATSPESDRTPQPSGQASTREAEGIVTSALEPTKTGASQTAAILDEAVSVDDVSFAVYLSTLWSVDEAKRYWQALRKAMPDVLRDKQMEIEEVAAASGTDPFYRVLTTPFTSDPEAQDACEQIKAKLRTHDCNVVVRDTTAGG